jgi:Flp pilus assembly protein TadB
MEPTSPHSKPPIPSPFGEPDNGASVPARRKPVENYLFLAVLGVVLFFVMRALILAVGPLVVIVAMLLLYAIVAGVATERLKRVGQKLGYRIGSEPDLQDVKSIITLNMRVSFLMIALAMSFLAALLFTGNGLYSVLLLIVTVPFGAYSTRAEARFRAMEIAPENPALALRFQDYLRQWKECRIKLED